MTAHRTPAPRGVVHPPWTDEALCIGADPSLFFSEPDADDNKARTAQAKLICEQCPTRVLCLAYGERISPDWGLYGGMTVTERRRERLAEDVAA